MDAAPSRPPTSAPLSTSATVDVVAEMASLLGTGLDRRAVQILMALVDAGVHPAALADAVKELRALSGGRR
jgi:mitotic-spindle organizing protein 1